jgi:hypothetical protein
MKRFALITIILSVAISSWAAPLGTSARTVIPNNVQQIISVDYRGLKASPTAMALKKRLLTENLKQFESALRDFGVDPDQDVETLTFASFRIKNGLQIAGIAEGNFPKKKILARLKAKKINGAKYRDYILYPMSGAMNTVFLDSYTMLFGEPNAVKSALDARDGEAPSLTSNSEMSDLIGGAADGTVWSVLDAQGSQNMLRSAMGDASKLADYDVVKNRLLGSRYVMDFSNGVAFDLNVVTSDSVTAATLSSLLKAGVLYKKMTASAVEKSALENVSVDSDSSQLKIHFSSDDKKFQSFLNSDFFAAVSK